MSDDMKGPIIFIWIMAIAMMINLCTVVSRSEAGVLSGLKCHKQNEQTTRESYDVLIQHVLFSLNQEHPIKLKKYIYSQLRRINTEYVLGFKRCEKIRLGSYK